MSHRKHLSHGYPIRHNFVTLLCVVASEAITTLSPRTMSQLFPLHRKRSHSHRGVRTYVLGQRLGIPYEVERTVCADCRQVLEERPLKRAAA
jgi:hypothetical protein